MEDCAFCKRYQNKEEVIFESERFYVCPSLGQIVEGYLLICTKEHSYIGMSHIPNKFFKELEEVQIRVRKLLSENYTPPIFFEHGPASHTLKGGCCIEHFHLHAVPVDVDLYEEIIRKKFKSRKISKLSQLSSYARRDMPYFYYENQKGERFVFKFNEVVPSQYLRQVLAVKLGVPEKWDWRVYPGFEEYKRTLEKLKQ